MKSSQLEINPFKVFLVLQQPHFRTQITCDQMRDLHKQVEIKLCKEITVSDTNKSRTFGDPEIYPNLCCKLQIGPFIDKTTDSVNDNLKCDVPLKSKRQDYITAGRFNSQHAFIWLKKLYTYECILQCVNM